MGLPRLNSEPKRRDPVVAPGSRSLLGLLLAAFVLLVSPSPAAAAGPFAYDAVPVARADIPESGPDAPRSALLSDVREERALPSAEPPGVSTTPGLFFVAPKTTRHLCSFSGETEVLMADGTTKPISEVEVGDWVLAEDPETGERGAREVTHLWVHQDTIIDLEIDGHDVATTEDHPFWNHTDSEWQRADALDSGDLVLTADGATRSVDGMDWGSARTTTAYNLSVDDIHTYYVHVGGDEVLVHNTSTCLPRFDGPKPTYHVNPAHVPGQGLRPGKTPLPSDAQDVFRTAVPNDPHNPTAWFGRNADGQTYRFSLGNDGSAHFSGIDGVGDGVRNLTTYARDRLDLLGG